MIRPAREALEEPGVKVTVYGDRAGVVKIIGDKRDGDMLGGHIVFNRATGLIRG